MSSPVPLPDTAFGPPPAPGRAVTLVQGLVRLTAPNPGVMTGPGTNTYLFGAGGPAGDVAVVDPGPDDDGHLRAVVAAASAAGGRVRWVLVTHAHLDHAPGARPLAEMTGATLVGHGLAGVFEPDIAAGEGWTLATASFVLRALHTPGHASDHLCYLVDLAPSGAGAPGPRHVLFSGDHLMDGVTVVIAPPDGDMAAYLASLRRVLALDPLPDAVAPGHGRLLGDPAALVEAVVAHRLAREELVARALTAAGSARAGDLVGAVYGDVDASLHPIACLSLLAHLYKLVGDGRATATGAGGDEVFTSPGRGPG